jgi:hypothetical protein
MHAETNLKNWIKELSARTHGQTGNVKTVFGRQLIFLKDSSKIMQLPNLGTISMQDLDLASPTYGMYYAAVDIDRVDGGVIR